MKRIKQGLAATALAAAVAMAAPMAGAQQTQTRVVAEDPNFLTMTGDALFARPIGLGATAVGSVLFVITLPFSALGGNVGQAAETLVYYPARETFRRCLGCTQVQEPSASSSRVSKVDDELAEMHARLDQVEADRGALDQKTDLMLQKLDNMQQVDQAVYGK